MWRLRLATYVDADDYSFAPGGKDILCDTYNHDMIYIPRKKRHPAYMRRTCLFPLQAYYEIRAQGTG